MTFVNTILVVLGTVMLVVGLSVGLLKRKLWMNGPFFAFLAGVLVGPVGFGWLPGHGTEGISLSVFKQIARLTIAATIMEGALRLPDQYVIDNRRPLFLILAVVMPGMWIASSLLSLAFLQVSFSLALLIGAVVTPTDPVVSSALVTGTIAERNIPKRLRNGLTSESIANDSLAYPLVMLPLIFFTQNQAIVKDWVLHTLLWGVVGAAAVGALLGWISGLALNWAYRHRDTDEVSILTICFSLALVALGAAKLMGSEGLLAVFTAGLTFRNTVNDDLEWSQERIQEAIARFFVLPVFAIFGLLVPWGAWADLGWAGVFLAILILGLRRVPAVMLSGRWNRLIKSPRDALIMGWFGPIGVAALYYAALAKHQTAENLVWTTTTLIVFSSLCAHSISATPFSRLYGKLSTETDSNKEGNHG